MIHVNDGRTDAGVVYRAACAGATAAELAEIAGWSPYLVRAAVGRALECSELRGTQLNAPIARLHWAEQMCVRRRLIVNRREPQRRWR